MSLFADDIILTITKLRIKLPTLEFVLSEFGTLSGLQVNYAKLKALNVFLPMKTVAAFKAAFPYPCTWASH